MSTTPTGTVGEPVVGQQPGPTSSARKRPVLLLVVGGCLLGIAAGWAMAVLLTRPAEQVVESSFTLATVERGEVGSSLGLNVAAQWPTVQRGSNQRPGIVTSVEVAPGAVVHAGEVLYTVDLRPVTVAEGTVPAFRDIGRGVRGRDVAALQRMLRQESLYGGTVDGTCGDSCVAAIRAWQRALGTAPDGVIRLGDVIFVPRLPARIALDPEVVTTGAVVAGGAPALKVLAARPEFSLEVTSTQAGLIPAGARVEISPTGAGTWTALTGSRSASADGQTVTIGLEPKDGTSICGTSCAQVPAEGRTLLPAQVITVEQVDGLVVPTSAIATATDGRTVLIDEQGRQLPVTVVATARGQSVVEGVEVGASVRVPASVGAG